MFDYVMFLKSLRLIYFRAFRFYNRDCRFIDVQEVRLPCRLAASVGVLLQCACVQDGISPGEFSFEV